MNHPNTIEPGQSWEVDLFRPEDAEGVTGLFRTVYGESYPVRTFIQPKRLIEENAAGRTISSVARTPRGDIVGHNALFNSAPWEGIYESGAGLVLPEYRGGKGIFTEMVAHGQEVAAEAWDVTAIFGEPVCNHVFSQKMTHGLGWVTMAMEVDLMPAAAYTKENSAVGRVSAILDFKILHPRLQTVYLPPVYERELRFLYKGLDGRRELAIADRNPPAKVATEIKTQVFDFAKVARLTVLQAGADLAEAVTKEETRVREQGVEVIQVWLRLSWPMIGFLVDELRGRGYFLGGILPRWFDDDGLLMQKLFVTPSWDRIQLHFDRARKIMDIVRSDWIETKAHL